jgi:O-antigen biosynthesis protein
LSELEDLYAHQAELAIENARLHLALGRYEANRAVALAVQATDFVRRALPFGSRRRRWAGRLVRAGRFVLRRPTPEQRFGQAYAAWLAARRPSPEELELQRKQSAAFKVRPLVSVCMPVHDPDPAALAEAVASVQRQSYEHWELCICDDASTRPGVRRTLEDLAGADPRIRLMRSGRNGGISRATNAALGMAGGDYVAFLDDDDVLEPHTLFLYVQELQRSPGIDLFYCDEDVLLPSGERLYPLLKPGWSPETLLGMNYVTHFVMARRELVAQVGGLRPERDGAQDHDLLLRLSERTSAIVHVPEVLYSWRQSERSTSLTSSAKPWAYEAGLQAVKDALERRGVRAAVEPGAFPGAYRVRYALPEPPPHVEIVIPTRDRADLLGPCLESIITRSQYPDYSVTVLDNDSCQPATAELLQRSPVRVVPAPGPFNYSAIMNRGFAATDAEFVLTLNNDTRVIDPHWISGLVELCAQPGVGAVGCRLEFGDGRLQHEGIALGCAVPAANLAFEAPGIRLPGIGLMRTARDVSAVTGACCLIRRSAWEAIGGFDEDFAVAYNDVDFCIRVRRAGYRVLYTPYVTVVHEESQSRGALHPARDEVLLLRRWAAEIVDRDPLFSPRLTIGPYGLVLDRGEGGFRGKGLVEISLRHQG